ncbi:hypothetical protein OSB04_020483 [Centaurea solstitialis]|uniref:CCHC-type domain-containing protein n=1 Tax=Centaurea solstitialis TaxID=347529 RepID=A0AA38WDB3_9ASTR|nr:hypothetical protein OSB04_020483 [Centaurea solstitialis]
MLKTAEKNIPKKPSQVLMIREGQIKKTKGKNFKAKPQGGKGKRKNVSKPQQPKKKEKVAKEDACFECGVVGHWKRNCPTYLAGLKTKKAGEGTSGFPNRKTRADLSVQNFRIGNCTCLRIGICTFSESENLIFRIGIWSFRFGVLLLEFSFSELIFPFSELSVFRIGKQHFPNRKTAFSESENSLSRTLTCEPNPIRKTSVSRSDFASSSLNSCKIVPRIRHLAIFQIFLKFKLIVSRGAQSICFLQKLFL